MQPAMRERSRPTTTYKRPSKIPRPRCLDLDLKLGAAAPAKEFIQRPQAGANARQIPPQEAMAAMLGLVNLGAGKPCQVAGQPRRKCRIRQRPSAHADPLGVGRRCTDPTLGPEAFEQIESEENLLEWFGFACGLHAFHVAPRVFRARVVANACKRPWYGCVFRRCRPGIPTLIRASFQSDAAHHSDLIAPGVVSSRRSVLVMSWWRCRGQAGARCLRRLSPFSSMRWALWMNRSRMASASVGLPTMSCQRSTGTWLVMISDPAL